MTNFIQHTLKRFVVYLVVVTQILIPTVQAGTFHFEIDLPEQRMTQHNNHERPTLRQINLKMKFDDRDLYSQNIDFNINGGNVAKKFGSSLPTIKPLGHAGNPINLTRDQQDSINIRYDFNNVVFDFSFNHEGHLCINYLKSSTDNFFFKCFNNIELNIKNPPNFKTSSNLFEKAIIDNNARDEFYRVKGISIQAKNNISNNVKIDSHDKAYFCSTDFTNNNEIHGKDIIDINAKTMKNNNETSIINAEKGLSVHNEGIDANGNKVLNKAISVLNKGKMTSAGTLSIHSDATDNHGLMASKQKIRLSGGMMENHEKGIVGPYLEKDLQQQQSGIENDSEKLKNQTSNNLKKIFLTPTIDFDLMELKNKGIVHSTILNTNIRVLSNLAKIAATTASMDGGQFTNDETGIIDFQNLILLKSSNFNNAGIIHILNNGILEIDGTNSGKILSKGAMSILGDVFTNTDTGLIDTKLLTFLRSNRFLNHGEILMKDGGALDIRGENYGKIHSQNSMVVKILLNLINKASGSIMSENGILNFSGESGFLENLGEIASRTEISLAYIYHFVNRKLLKSEIIRGTINKIDNYDIIDGAQQVDLNVYDMITNHNLGKIKSDNVINLTSDDTINDGIIASQNETHLKSNRSITNRNEIQGSNTLSVLTPVFNHEDHSNSKLISDNFSFNGHDLLLKGKTFFDKTLAATVTGKLDYSTPEPTTPTEKVSSTLSANVSVIIKLMKGTIDKKIQTPAVLEISLLPETREHLLILADIITQKGASFKAGTQELSFGTENCTEDGIAPIPPKIQTAGPLTLQGNSVDIINAALAAKGRTQVIAPVYFRIGRITLFLDGISLYNRGNGSSLATANFLDIETQSTTINDAFLMCKLGSKVISPQGFYNNGGRVNLGGNSSFETITFINQILGINLDTYMSTGGSMANYVSNCLSKAPKGIFTIGGDLNFTGLVSGLNFGSDIYVGGQACPEMTKIINAKFFGAGEDVPATHLPLDHKSLKNRARLIRRGVSYPSVEEINRLKDQHHISRMITINAIRQERNNQGTPNGANNNFYTTGHEGRIVKFLTENDLYQPCLREIKTIAEVDKKKHRKRNRRAAAPVLREERATRSSMIITPTFSAGKSITLNQDEGILRITCSIQAPTINANFYHMIVGQAIPYGAIIHSEFQQVQRLFDYVRPNQLHQFDLNNPLALISYPEVLQGCTKRLPKQIIITRQGLQTNTQGLKQLYHPDIEKEALREANFTNLRRGYLDKDYTNIDEQYMLEREMADNIYEQLFNMNALTYEESEPISEKALSTLIIDKKVLFNYPALFYSKILHEQAGDVLEPIRIWPNSWEKETENVRDNHNGYFAREGTFIGKKEDDYGEGQILKGIRKVDNVKLIGNVIYKNGQVQVDTIGSWTGEETEIDFKTLEITPGAKLNTGHTLFRKGKVINQGRIELDGMSCLTEGAEIVNERVQLKTTVKVTKKTTTKKRHGIGPRTPITKCCGVYKKTKKKTKTVQLATALPAAISGYYKALGFRTGNMHEKTELQTANYLLPITLDNAIDVLEGTLMIYEINENQQSNFIPFIETEGDTYALYITDEYVGEDEDEKDRRRKYNRGVMSGLLNTTKAPYTSDLNGKTVSFKILDEIATFNKVGYQLATVVRISPPEEESGVTNNAANMNSTGQNSSPIATEKSVAFKNFVQVSCYDALDNPSSLPQRKTDPLRITPPEQTLTKRKNRQESILDWIFPNFVIEDDARCGRITNIGGLFIAGEEGMDIRTREAIVSIPLVDVALKKYFSSKGSTTVSGSVGTHTVVIPGFISDGHTTLISDKSTTLTATQVLARKKILLESKEYLDLGAKVIKQTLPPKVSKNKGLTTLTEGTMEMGFVTKIASSEDNIRIVSTTGRVIGKAPVISGCGKNVVESAKGTQIDALVLNHAQTSKTSGFAGAFNYIDQKSTKKHQTAMQPVLAPKDKVRKITKGNGDVEKVIEEGEIIFKTLNGDIILGAPEMHGTVILRPIKGDGKIDSVILKSSEKSKKKTYSVNFWGKAALENAMNGEKPGSVLNSLVRESSLFSTAGDLCVSKDAQGALASGLKAAYETFQALEAINGAKSLTEFGLSKIASVGVSFGTSSSKEKQTTVVKPKAMAGRDVKIIADDKHDATFVGLEGEVRNLEGKGENVSVKSPIQTFKKDTKDASYAVDYNIATNSVSVSVSMAKGKQRGTQHAHGNLKVTGTTTLNALDLVTVAAPVSTKHLNLKAKRLLVESKQNKFKSSQKSAGGGVGMDGGSVNMSSSSTNITNIGQQSCLRASHTSHIKVEDRTTLDASAISVGDEAIAKPSRDAQGNLDDQEFFEHPVEPDGDCALHCLNLSRDKAVRQLIEEGVSNADIRKALLRDLLSIIGEREIYNDIIPSVTNTQTYQQLQAQESVANRKVAAEMTRLNDFYNLLEVKDRKSDLKGFHDLLGGSRPDLMVLESLVDTHNQKAQEKKAYLLQPEIFASIIHHGYGKKYQENWLFFSYDAIDVLAEINGLHVIIKQLSADNTYDTVHEHPVDNGEVVIMLHTMAGTEGGFCPGKNQTLNHFNLLSLHRGVLISPKITYKNVRNVNKSKSTSVGVSASPGGAIPGTASFSHNSQNTQTDTLATISSNFHVETKSDISGINRDANNTTKKIKDSKTHVEAFVPLVNPMDLPKLWDRAVDNFNGAIDKPLMTPPKKPQVTPAFMDWDDKQKALERTKALKIDIVNTLREQGASADEIKTILYDEGMKDLIDKSCGVDKNSKQISHIQGQPPEINITEGNMDPLDRCLGIISKGAEKLSDFSENYPTLTSYSLTAIQLVLSGPAGFARDTVCEAVGVHDAVDEVTNVAKGWFSNELQGRLGVSEGYADMGAEAGYFGVILGFGTIGGASKDKILEAAKGVKEKTKVYLTYLKPHPTGGTSYVGRTSGLGDVNDPNSLKKILEKRDRNHHKNAEGFGRAQIDKVSTNPAPIRGQEQLTVDKLGGAQSKGGTSSNKINGISDTNPRGDHYISEANKEFGA